MKTPSSDLTTAAGDGGDDGEFIGVGDGGVFFGGEVADVVVVEVDVDEGAEFALGVEEVLAKFRVGGGELGEHRADGRAGDGDGFFAVGVGAQRCRDVDVHACPFGVRDASAISISMASSWNFLSSSVVPRRRKELVMAALPFST